MNMPIMIEMEVSNRRVSVPMEASNCRASIPMEVGNGGVHPIISGDYNDLDNKPSINSVELIGNKTSADLGIDQTFVYQQNVASDEWIIEHNLHKFPSVTVVDSAGTVVVGEVAYVDDSTIRIRFIGAFSGAAYLN